VATTEAVSEAARLDRIVERAVAFHRWTFTGTAAYWAVVGLCGGVGTLGAAVWLYQVYWGLATTALLHPVMWGTYIATFVFWIGIAHAGTFMSAILFLFRARWRIAIARFAETMTLAAIGTAMVFPLIHLGRPWRAYWLIPYPNERLLSINLSSPLIWDAAAIATYFVASVLFWFIHLVPDFATLRDRSTGVRRLILGWLAVGWTGTIQEWTAFRATYGVLAGIIAMLVVSVHSIVSWDFAAAIVPGWHSTLFAPYFVAGAMFSGLAMLLLLVLPGRELLGLTDRITPAHLDKVATLMLALSLIVTYSYATEAAFALAGRTAERAQFVFRLTGPYAFWFWLSIGCNSIVPLCLFMQRLRRSVTALAVVATAVTIGMWLERFVIIVASLAHDYSSYAAAAYRPTYVEATIVVGSLAWFLFWFLLLIGHIPPVSIAEEQREAIASAPMEGAA
jgi:molybdopterin-containing oxidoreductase family membrane subunit